MSWPFDPVAIAPIVDRAEVERAIEGFQQSLTPAKKIHPDRIRADQRELANLIGKIGNRIRPDFNDQQAKKWAAEVVDALSDHPVSVALAAARDAKHFPFRYPGEVHAQLIELAKPHLAAYRNALRNLEKLLKAIDHPSMLEASNEAKAEAQRISDDELQEAPAHLRQLGITAGFLVEESDGRIRWASDDEQDAHRKRIEAERHHARARDNGKD